MDKNTKFLRCEHCGAIVNVVKKGAKIICCGEEMKPLKANSTDAAQEKHVPVVTKDNGKIIVEVGSVEHPSTEDHLIEWVAAVSPKRTEIAMIFPGERPYAEFVDYGKTDIYAFCNLHGLWVSKTEDSGK